MQETQYLIVGASHAGLSALHTLRMADSEGSVTLVNRDASLPYSPTVLPYVVSGRSKPDNVALQGEAYFTKLKVAYRSGIAVSTVDAKTQVATLADGERIAYQKLLVASGARPIVPPIPGLAEVPFHVLRTLDDAVQLRAHLASIKSAVVLGAGLIGMHAAENLAKAGAQVTIVEMLPHVLAAYFDAEASTIIERAFTAKGVSLRTGEKVVGVEKTATGCKVKLQSGGVIDADALLVGVGVTPIVDFLAGSGVAIDRGVLVDDTMKTSVENIWAAGDVAQAKSFYSGEKILNGILPDAVEQGRIAGLAMAGDAGLKPYPGGIPLNTYTFFGQQALSVGVDGSGMENIETEKRVDRANNKYLKIALQNNRLIGIFGINAPFDSGVMWELIQRRTDLTPVKAQFLAQPRETARVLMSRIWR
ncbi:phenylglyoxylate dehydrogenase epsilon subunit [Burkholderiales bacterium]|nr:MAG: FAD-dependent oxidoreductase [Burkholderiales bacterium]CAG1006988.1 phenylglyoxylate dehydrogenase epsilon subunit [Burkholderiales bacterium]